MVPLDRSAFILSVSPEAKVTCDLGLTLVLINYSQRHLLFPIPGMTPGGCCSEVARLLFPAHAPAGAAEVRQQPWPPAAGRLCPAASLGQLRDGGICPSVGTVTDVAGAVPGTEKVPN